MDWVPWEEGDPMPMAGPYWVTATSFPQPYATYKELLPHQRDRRWRYVSVIAYMQRTSDSEPKPPPYEPE